MSRVLAPLRHLLHIMVEWIIGSAIHRAFARLIYLPSIVRLIVREGPKQRWYDRVDDTVILGALPFRSQTKQLVDKENVQSVLSFNEPYELQLFTNSQEEWERNGVSQHIFPTLDFHPPTLENLREGLKIITAARSNKHTVYIHCKAGKGRSAVMTTCYLMSRYKLTPADAIDFLERKRPQVSMNKWQRAAIESFHQHLLHKSL